MKIGLWEWQYVLVYSAKQKLIWENVFDNIQKKNTERAPENSNDTFIYIVSLKKRKFKSW